MNLSVKNDLAKKLQIPGLKTSTQQITVPTTTTSGTVAKKPLIPSLCAYDDDDDEEEDEEVDKKETKQESDEEIAKHEQELLESSAKLKNLKPETKPAASSKPSGLLGILPPPKANTFMKAGEKSDSSAAKSTTSSLLLPRTLKSKSANEETIASKKFKPEIPSTNFLFYEGGEDPDLDFLDDDLPTTSSIRQISRSESVKITESNYEEANISSATSSATATGTSELLDQEAWVKLCGSKRKQKEEIEFTDVNANEIVGNNSAELMKQITSEYRPPSNKDYFGGGSRKKHQITYLAYVARERDQELRNMWAQSKFNKQQARQKYGF